MEHATAPKILKTLKKRAAFLAAARGETAPKPGLLLQARNRGDDQSHIGVGFTCSKKVGNAVTRNRAKRRLRAAAQSSLQHGARPGWDYVLIGRRGATIERPFHKLCADVEKALATIHGSPT